MSNITSLVLIENGSLVTTTLAIAEGTQNEHASVIKLTRSYLDDLEEFGRVRFEIAPFETSGGTQMREIAVLNEQHATLLLTYMRNSNVVREFKKNLVKAFWQMAQQLKHKIPESLPEALRLAADLADNLAKKEAELAIAAPKARALDLISAQKDSMTLTQAAKKCGMKVKEFIALLHAYGWVYRQNGAWVAYDKHIKNGCLEYKEAVYTDEKTGLECRKSYCHVTPKGLVKLAEMFSIDLEPA